METHDSLPRRRRYLDRARHHRSKKTVYIGKKYKKGKYIFNLSPKGNLKEAGKNLYKILRKMGPLFRFLKAI